MYAIADIIVNPAVAALQAAVGALEQTNRIATAGVPNAGQWLGPVAWLGPGWESAISTILIAGSILVALQAAIAAYRVYLALKAGVKWW